MGRPGAPPWAARPLFLRGASEVCAPTAAPREDPAPLVRGKQIWVKRNLPSQQPPRQGQQRPGPAEALASLLEAGNE